MGVAARFAGYHPAGHLVTGRAPLRAAWLTGQSSYRHSQLSPAQTDLLHLVAAAGYQPVVAGFPYHRQAVVAAYRAEPILAASARNTAQFLAARYDRRFRAELARHLAPLVGHTTGRLLLLCGSCGLELLTAALPLLSVPPSLRILAVALGPVGRLPAPSPWLRLHVLQARSDSVSRLGYRGPVDLVVPGGHLGYATDPQVRAEVLRLATEFLR